MELTVTRAKSVCGSLRPPSDKSLTHRAYMLAAIASSPTEISTPLRSEDCEATLGCLKAMGLRGGPDWLEPAKEWVSPDKDLDCGNSGTTMRLLTGLIASRPIRARLIGDESLSRRPMGRIAKPLRMMGAHIEGENPPLSVKGGSLAGISYVSPVASAQVKSCILLAGLRADGLTSVLEPSRSRDHTERMLAALGVPVEINSTDGKVTVTGNSARIPGFQFHVPADISSSAFWLVAAAILPKSEMTLTQVGVNPTRTGILEVLEQSGIDVQVQPMASQLGEPVADITVRSGSGLCPFSIGGDMVPRLIDEIPVLAVLATQCDGISRIRNAQELRIKESDRLEAVARGLRSMGARVETMSDGMEIEGPVNLRGAVIESASDHRIAMAFAIAGLIAEGETVIVGAESINTSYPDFVNHLQYVRRA